MASNPYPPPQGNYQQPPPIFMATRQGQIAIGNVKSIFSSTTFWGAAIALVAAVSPKLLATLGITATNQTAVIGNIVAVIGWIVTIYGRFTATKTVTLLGK